MIRQKFYPAELASNIAQNLEKILILVQSLA